MITSKQLLTDWSGPFAIFTVIVQYIPIRIDQRVLLSKVILVPKGEHYGKVSNPLAPSFNLVSTLLNFKPTKVNACYFLNIVFHFYSHIIYIIEGLFGNLVCDTNFIT